MELKDDIRLYCLGESAITIESTKPASIGLQKKIWCITEFYRNKAFVSDVVPGMNNLTIIFDMYQIDLKQELQVLLSLWQDIEMSSYDHEKVIEVPVIYGGDNGPDLKGVAAYHGISQEEVVRLHSDSEYIVYFLGFQPGFAYLGGMPARLTTPRHASPRAIVPKGSVAIGGAQTGVYPNRSPGGWQIIGKTDVELFDVNREQPAIWMPGDRVHFVAKEILTND
ncbi:5-oxoprolinase subunit PxpB [Vibrio salinus]|uniref:5-oxoprolinase subunit PxpB n=1 Tax=Vibrio salinus TaxID=2899784 RepID=UPI001E5B960A|nr:5-oxoprolinase subunit PxpB [Vibrio salinus]MCE0496157.1 5-oxoprolinase subunit PxpB [Vibrio salinus]